MSVTPSITTSRPSRALIRRAMDLGYYEGVNLSLAYCDDCGHQELEMDVCPVCGSRNLTKIDRMNGYLSYSRVHGDTRSECCQDGGDRGAEIHVKDHFGKTARERCFGGRSFFCVLPSCKAEKSSIYWHQLFDD